jgi:uncharacterized membrane protein YheB (UPF0754 family)
MTILNKASITNLVALLISLIGVFTGDPHIKAIGFYALSGAITNWIAIFMLFEKVPFLYGSGIIPNHFEDFKRSIKNLFMKQFFNQKHIDEFLEKKLSSSKINLDGIIEAIDYDQLFDGFVDAIMESQFGGMIGSFLGGKEGLNPLKDSFVVKIKKTLTKMLESDKVQSKIKKALTGGNMSNISVELENLIDSRLNDLTPKMVKDIIQQMIRQHLGWLVIWGGIFGGLIGCVVSFIP